MKNFSIDYLIDNNMSTPLSPKSVSSTSSLPENNRTKNSLKSSSSTSLPPSSCTQNNHNLKTSFLISSLSYGHRGLGGATYDVIRNRSPSSESSLPPVPPMPASAQGLSLSPSSLESSLSTLSRRSTLSPSSQVPSLPAPAQGSSLSPSSLESSLSASSSSSSNASNSSKGTGANKPPYSYIALISMAILYCKKKKILLGDIYQYIMDIFPYYNNKEKTWRNSIRHNLSLNECFIKNGRADNGNGNYWSIHPACFDDFSKGDFRRRQARRRARKSTMPEVNSSCSDFHCNAGYVPMTSSAIPGYTDRYPVYHQLASSPGFQAKVSTGLIHQHPCSPAYRSPVAQGLLYPSQTGTPLVMYPTPSFW